MGTKYEIRYWDYIHNAEVVAERTNSLFRALWLLHKLEKKWYCVTIKFRRDKVRQQYIEE